MAFTQAVLFVGLLSGCSCEVGGDDVGGVAVEGSSGPVVAHRGSGVCVRGRFLDVSEWNAGIESGGDERMPQRVGSDALIDPGSSGEPSYDAAA